MVGRLEGWKVYVRLQVGFFSAKRDLASPREIDPLVRRLFLGGYKVGNRFLFTHRQDHHFSWKIPSTQRQRIIQTSTEHPDVNGPSVSTAASHHHPTRRSSSPLHHGCKSMARQYQSKVVERIRSRRRVKRRIGRALGYMYRATRPFRIVPSPSATQ